MSNLFQNKFSEREFVAYASEYLPDFNPTDSRVEERRGFTGIKQIGESPKLDLAVFAVIPEASINARMEISKLSYALLKTHPRAHALIAYHSPESDEWRLSLITTQVTRDKKGIKETVSNPRRFSYVLGPKAKVNTPTKYLFSKGKIADLKDLKERFSLEVVNKDFYREISNLFTKLTGGTRATGKDKNKYIPLLQLPSVSEGDQRNLEFAVRLIGRVIFCWFLREKKSSTGIALMPKELLSHDAVGKNPDYYHSILEPIFFEVLNKHVKSRKDRYTEQPFSSIPYLNGGLFSPDYDDYFSYNEGKQAIFHNTVVVPDEWLKEFFGFLETYNFTIDENVSFDEELSIDPEMLGRIFENLLAEINPETGESARKNTGSYYTPRAIVDYMVDESLLVYLKEKTSIAEEKLRAVISYDLEDNLQHPLSEEEFGKVTEALSKIKILDPACGSGAFPIGALQKIVFILQQVDPDGHRWFEKQVANTAPEIKRIIEREFANKNFNYIRKLGVIRENIFGVDIQPIATEISRLRCFLTLVVDESIHDGLENRGIEPLPNLDFKFVTANTLIQLPGSKSQTLFKDQERINQLKELRSQFFSSTNSERQRLQLEFKELQNQMLDRMIETKGEDEITRTLSTWNPFSHKGSSWFDPEWMFGIEDGFDMVIANPPYISAWSMEKNDPTSRETIKKALASYSILVGHWDLYVAFVAKGHQLLKNDGSLSYIMPNPILREKYATAARKFLLTDMRITSILEFNDVNVFDSVARRTTVLVAQKKAEEENYEIDVHGNNNGDIIGLTKKIDRNLWLNHPRHSFLIDGSDDKDVIIKKVDEQSDRIGNFFYVNYGAQVSSKTKGSFGKKDVVGTQKIGNAKPFYEGKDIKRWKLSYRDLWLDYKAEEMYGPRHPALFEQPKIAVRMISDKGHMLAAALDNTGHYSNHSVVLIASYQGLEDTELRSEFGDFNHIEASLDLRYVLAVLLSKLESFYFRKRFATESLQGSTSHTYPSAVRSLPIKNILPKEQGIFIKMVDEILSITSKSDYAKDSDAKSKVQKIEGQLNAAIYNLYGLSEEEIKIIEETIL